MSGSGAQRVSLPHIAALDGLRGLAVLGILLFHAEHLPGGWLGVDLFFVLSGFLITSLLLVEYERTSGTALAAFWGRRARRLLPALLLTLLGVCLYALWIARPEELARIRADVIATLFYVANWHSIVSGHDYWEIFRSPSPLDHTWSLAIEEQFYLLWPPAFLLIMRRTGGSQRVLTAVALGLALLSASWMAALYDPERGTARVYYGTDTRVAATLVGAAVAAAFRSRVRDWPGASRRAGDVVAGLGLLALLAASISLDGNAAFVYRGGLFALVLASAGVIVGVLAAPVGFVSRALSAAPLTWLGTVSYGVYLWHWPLYLVLTSERIGWSGGSLTALRIAATLLVAALSYVALERPVRRGNLPPRRLVAGVLAASLAVLGCAWWVTRAAPGPEAPPVAREAGSPTGFGADVLLIGDSLAHALGTEFVKEAHRRGRRVHVNAAEGCGSLRSTALRFLGGQTFSLLPCVELRERWVAAVARARPEVVLLLEGWSGEGSKQVGGRWLHPCEPDFDRAFAADLADLVRRFAAAGARTMLARMPPPIARDLSPNYARQWGRHGEEELHALFQERMVCLNRVRGEVAQSAGAQLVDLAGQICPDGRCRSELHGFALRPDGMHFSGASAAWLSGWLLDELRRSGRADGR